MNFLFERMMIKELGNVVYDQEARLNLGAKMLEPEKEEDVQAEVMILNLPEEEEDEKYPVEISAKDSETPSPPM